MSDASDLEYEGAGEFANVMNEMNNAADNGGKEEIDEEEDANDAGIGVQGGLVWRADEGQPSVADDDGVVGAVAGEGEAPPDGVAPAAVARPVRGRGPGRSRTHPASAPAGVVRQPPAATAVGRNGSAAPAPAVARNDGSDGQMSGSSGTVAAPGGDRGRAFRTPINRGRKKSCTDDDEDGSFSVSSVMGMMRGGDISSARGDCYASRGDDVAAADSARGESCASAHDERHADGDDAKNRQDQSAAEDDEQRNQ